MRKAGADGRDNAHADDCNAHDTSTRNNRAHGDDACNNAYDNDTRNLKIHDLET